MSGAMKEMTLLPGDDQQPTRSPEQPIAPSATETSILPMLERLATNPDVDVAKLERLIAMQERILAHNAKAAFDAAFAEMQGEIPVITEQGEIEVDGRVRSTYARNEDIQRIVKPILQKHGFALRFRHELTDGKLKVIGILSHRSGHSEQDEFITAADTSGKKNDIQALGSARSYGQRYTSIALLNIATCDEDDDGQTAKSAPKAAAPAPDGYVDWLARLTDIATDGTPTLQKAWKESTPEHRNHLIATNPKEWDRVKTIAARALAAAKKAQGGTA